MTLSKYSPSSKLASAASSAWAAVIVGSKVRATATDHALNKSRSECGTPTISAITINGRGFAYSSRKSNSVRSPILPISSSATDSTLVCHNETAFGVNACATRERSRVWSGGSDWSMLGASASTISETKSRGWFIARALACSCSAKVACGTFEKCL